MHRTSRSSHTPRLKCHVLCFASTCSDVSTRPPCFGHFRHGGLISSFCTLCDPGVSFFRKLARSINSTIPLNEVTKRPPVVATANSVLGARIFFSQSPALHTYGYLDFLSSFERSLFLPPPASFRDSPFVVQSNGFAHIHSAVWLAI